MSIEITTHIAERYIQRFNPQLASIVDYNQRLIEAKKAINHILEDAVYINNDERGVLLRSNTYKAYLVVNQRTLITIYPLDEKTKIRELKLKGRHG